VAVVVQSFSDAAGTGTETSSGSVSRLETELDDMEQVISSLYHHHQCVDVMHCKIATLLAYLLNYRYTPAHILTVTVNA